MSIEEKLPCASGNFQCVAVRIVSQFEPAPYFGLENLQEMV